ncbi:MAG: c-type cytochrome [Proteobacteria bacterium]|nr:c-type cytochrome [Pseudomonadota bacterium]
MDKSRLDSGLARGRMWTALMAGMLAAVILGGPLTAAAGEIESTLAYGGLLYDKWFKVVNAETPATAHPAYPDDGKYKGKKGADWRCKECHGWDYQGRDGAYASGKHFTGIKGVRGMAGADTDTIIAVLKDKTHGYTGEMMSDADFEALALFVSKGQVDMDRYIDRATRKVKGDAAKGEAYYNTICANCHGKDGAKVKDMNPMGKVVDGNPWESLHKVLNGQPGETMPAMRALDIQISLDALAYAQGLPKEK